jgi:photosystem II stability/assembly factor-like uncharacterized protein
VNSGTSRELRGVAFGSRDVGVIVGVNGLILRTEDAGRRWSPVPSGTRRTLHAAIFSGPEEVVAVGDGGTVLRSIDGGRHWSSVRSATSAALRDLTADAGALAPLGADGRRPRAEQIVQGAATAAVEWSTIPVARRREVLPP